MAVYIHLNSTYCHTNNGSLNGSSRCRRRSINEDVVGRSQQTIIVSYYKTICTVRQSQYPHSIYLPCYHTSSNNNLSFRTMNMSFTFPDLLIPIIQRSQHVIAKFHSIVLFRPWNLHESMQSCGGVIIIKSRCGRERCGAIKFQLAPSNGDEKRIR